MTTSGVKASGDEAQGSEELQGEEATRFRAVAARANYLAQDRLDIAYAAKEVCRHMVKPTKDSWTALKRLGIFLLKCPRQVVHFPRLES